MGLNLYPYTRFMLREANSGWVMTIQFALERRFTEKIKDIIFKPVLFQKSRLWDEVA